VRWRAAGRQAGRLTVTRAARICSAFEACMQLATKQSAKLVMITLPAVSCRTFPCSLTIQPQPHAVV
jgi:hypothetical protein